MGRREVRAAGSAIVKAHAGILADLATSEAAVESSEESVDPRCPRDSAAASEGG